MKKSILLQSLALAFALGALLTTHLAAQVVPGPVTRPTPIQRPQPTRPTPPGTGQRLTPGGRPGLNLPGAAAQAETPKADGSLGQAILDKGLKFDGADSVIVLQSYADLSGKTLIYHPQVPKANITLMSNPSQELKVEDYLYAIRLALNQNGIEIRPFGDGSLFLNVVPLNLPTGVTPDEPEPLTYSNGVITTTLSEPPWGRTRSIVYQLLHITTEEGRKIIEPYKRPEGQIIAIERNNSIQIIDTFENITVMVKLLEAIDKPIPVTEEVYSRKILFAKAADIKRKLEEFVTKSQEQTQGAASTRLAQSGPMGVETVQPRPRPPTPGIVRPPLPGLPATPETPANNPSINTAVSDADRGMIRGKVQIIDDERTNMLIIITNPQNMEFFDKIIAVFDIETIPDVMVDVIRMEHAAASDVASLLNDLLGSTKAAENTAPVTGRGPGARRGGTLAEAAAANAETPAAPSAAALSDATQSRIGELNKDNIKILHDERSNAVIIMATRSDLATLRELIRSVDIQLSQVLIEVVILDLILDNNFEFGMDWLNRKLSIHGGDIRAQAAWGGGKPTQPVLIGRDYPDETAPGLLGGATSLFTVEKLNLDGVIRATVGDNNAQILASPILLTMDNKEATIQATELRYLFNGYRYNYYGNNNSSDSYQEDIQQREIGLTVKVTPRINQKGMVVLTITGTFETVGGNQSVGGKDWPTVNKREINSDIAVNNGETVILGGLNRREKSVDKAGVPYLRNIPLLGWFFRYTKETEKRSELLVFMTPYVLDTASQRAFETGRRKRVAGANADIWSEHVSGSTLAAPDPVEELRLLRGQLAGNESLQKAEEKLLQFRIEHENEIQRFEQRRQASPPPASPEQEEWEEWEGWEDWEEWHDWQEWPEDDAEPAPPPSRDDVAAMRKFFQKNPGAAGEVVMDSGAAPLRVTTALNTPGVVVLTRSQAASAGLINSLLVEMEQP